MRMGFQALLQVGFLGDLLPVPAMPDQPHAPTTWGLPAGPDGRLT